jgi:hypothetical protein
MSHTPPFALLALTGLLVLTACGEPPAPEPQPLTALTRPLLMLDIRSGRVLIPQAALIERGGVPGVFVLEAQNVARFRMVRVGKAYGGQVEILSGLTGTETLILGELREVRDGSLIVKR